MIMFINTTLHIYYTMRRRSLEKEKSVVIRPIHIIGARANDRPSVMELPDYKMKMLEVVTGSRNKDEAIMVLKTMHPGLRELRLRNEIARQYGNANWESDVEKYTKLKQQLYEQYGLKEPTQAEKLETIRDENNLTEAQKYALANMFKTRISNLELAASIQLKLRKTDRNKFSLKMFDDNEKKILDKILPGKAPLEEKATLGELQRVKYELIEKHYMKNENKNGQNLEKKVIYSSALALYNSGECGIETLRHAVREKKEAEILLEFMNREPQHIVVFPDRGLTRGKNSTNEDALLSADIHENGKTKRLDVVFDGVGESDEAASASTMASEVFVLGLLLKSPGSKEDLEMLMSMVDLAIFTSKDPNTGLTASSTTAVAFLSNGKKSIACHAGDSKWMVFRKGKLKHFSADHSIAEDLKKEGLPCPEELEYVIKSALGTGSTYIEPHTLKLKKDDLVLLCSDGISDTVAIDEMEKIFSEEDDAELSESRIFVLAVLRDDHKKEYTSITGNLAYGKLDDKTLIIFKIE